MNNCVGIVLVDLRNNIKWVLLLKVHMQLLTKKYISYYTSV